MPTPVRRRLRLARRGAWYALALLLVLLALVVGIASQLLPLAERHPERIAAWLSERAGRPVAFDRVQTHWTRRGPLLRMDGLRIGPGADAVPIGAAEIQVSQYVGWLPGRSFTELRLRGLQLTLERHDDGRWQVRGLPGQQAGGDPLEALEGLGELQVVDGRLTILAPSLDMEATLPRIDLRLRVDDARVRVATRAWMREGESPVRAVLDFDRSRGNGRAWATLREGDLAAWSALRVAGVAPVSGTGSLSAWATLEGHRVTAVTTEATLEAVRVATAAVGGEPHAFGRIDARARWTALDAGWRFDAPRLRFGAGAEAQVLDGLVVAGGERIAVLADQVDAGGLLALAALDARMPAGLRDWVRRAEPDAVLRRLELAGLRGGPLRASATVEDLRIAAVGDAPGMSGLSGRLEGDATGFAFTLEPDAEVAFDWPTGFGAPHLLRLRGTVAGWREGTGWHVGTGGLRIDGTDYGADARGTLAFQGDGSRPAIDLALQLDRVAVPVARRFWVRNAMSPKAIEWLDAALVGGHVEGGRALLSGDLDDWPFRGSGGGAAAGVFRAEARLDQAVVRFQPGWPPAERVDGTAVFLADGFEVIAATELAGIAVPRVRASIDHYGGGTLSVDAAADTDAARLLALLRRSPLHREHGETLDALRARGPVSATFALAMRMRAGEPASLSGDVRLRGATLADTRWDLAFGDVRGSARYGGEGFTADGLQVVRDGQPGRLDLRAGAGHVRDRDNALEGGLAMALSSRDLVQRAPQLAWLGPYMQGRSPWTVSVAVPRAAGRGTDTAGRLELRSSLVGTRLALPAPLAKPAAETLPARIETRLPLEQGEVSVALGERIALRARSVGGRTGVRVVLGSSEVPEPPPVHGLVATGSTPEFDAIEWAAIARPDADPGDPADAGLPLRRIDIAAARLRLLGGSFPRSRVRATPSAGGTRVQVDGPALAGSLLLPAQDQATLSGRLERLYWNSAPAAGGRDAVVRRDDAAQPPPPANDTDPAALPALDIRVEDLRFRDLHLGRATLATRPVASGLRIDQLRTVAEGQRVDVTGTWTGRGDDARTRMRVDVRSEDFGSLASALGAGGRLEGGDGEAVFDAAWPGSPAGFRLGVLQGRLALTVKDGRLVEVEPGAGRVLGLLSIAELPRRLTLDFRDFFEKGFAFNRIHGEVHFGEGQANSDDLVIDGPAAEIRIRGTADLRAQTYDQTIEVFPKTGNLLAAVGAITAGPVGAAVGAMANAVLRKPIGEMGAKVYRVTGPWKQPKVEVAERAPAPPAAPAPARDPG